VTCDRFVVLKRDRLNHQVSPSLLLFEHSWASKFVTAVQNAEGTVIALPTSTRLVGRAMR